MMQRIVPAFEIKWKGLWDKNSNKMYALDQLLLEEQYKRKHKDEFEGKMTKYRKLWSEGEKEDN